MPREGLRGGEESVTMGVTLSVEIGIGDVRELLRLCGGVLRLARVHG
jgi:hypothetical protein